MKYTGKLAEYLVLSELLRRDVEAYPAISFKQEDYDITVVHQDNTIARVQVKGTELQNKSTNNSIDGVDRTYDFLVLVIFDDDEPQFFVLTKDEVKGVREDVGTLYTSRKENGRFVVREYLEAHKDKWTKIVDA